MIVVVDDEQAILDLLEATLDEGGYEVVGCATSRQALDGLSQGSARALVTDVNLVGDALSGWDLAQRARELDPDIPVIYMTGDSGGDWSARGVPKSLLLEKPFAPAQVVTAVSQLLNELGPSSGHNGE